MPINRTPQQPPTWQIEYWPTMTPDLQQELQQVLELMESGRVGDAYNQLSEIVYPQNWNVNET
jgi:hypothetical protein